MSVSPTYYACFLNNYNNYFNRIIKGFATLAEYQTEVGTGNFYLYSQPVNYAPNDNVSTELIMNDCPFEPDYLLILNSDLDIVARWFVVHSTITRNGQRKFELRRDLIFDFKEELKDSPMFVQKGYLRDSDAFIVNDEGMSFNQIKSDELLLKDRTNSAWIVGYIAKNAAASDVSIQVADEDFEYVSFSELASAAGVSEADLASVLNFDGQNNSPAYFTKRVQFLYCTKYAIGIGKYREYLRMSPDLASSLLSYTYRDPFWQDILWDRPTGTLSNPSSQYFSAAIIANKAALLADIPTIFNRKYFTEAQLNILRSYEGKIIRYNGIYYQLKFNGGQVNHNQSTGELHYTSYTSLRAAVEAASTAMGVSPLGTGDIFISLTSDEYFLQMQYISDESGVIPAVQTKISSSRNTVENQAFDMFCIPYGPAKFKGDTGSKVAVSDYALSIGAQIAVELDAQLYDLQLLPYCPLLSLFDADNEIDLTALSADSDFNYIDKTQSRIRTTVPVENFWIQEDPDNPGLYQAGGSIVVPDTALADILAQGYTVDGPDASNIYSGSVIKTTEGTGVRLTFTGAAYNDTDDNITLTIWYEVSGTDHASFILWARNATFQTKLNYSLSLSDSMKVDSQCNFYRLISPNYQGSFEFNLAKNGGSVAYFLAECTYKPYTPYIKVVPQLSFLYGMNYGDNRGLLCGGDFSLPRFNSAWESYQLNNKNYQNIFNRDIQNLSLEQTLEKRQQVITGAGGILTAGIVGAGVGAKAGGVYGAIAGAAVGSAGSAAGFAVDLDMLASRQKEARSLAVDKYNYQLGNIKALPYTLTKIGAFDINSKIWPFLEYYTCTDEEKEALENKITYESMTVMRIDLIGNYLEAFDTRHYLKGELIRNETIADDNHILEALNYEFTKGVYC